MRPTALLVDDDSTTLLAFPDLLHHKIPRLRVETTTDVTDALARLDVRSYSVVLTDLRMPRMNGLTFLREASGGSQTRRCQCFLSRALLSYRALQQQASLMRNTSPDVT